MSKETVYTAAVVDDLIAGYTAVLGENYEIRNEFLLGRANKLGVSLASVRSKVVAAGKYKSKETSPVGSKGASKSELIAAFAAVTGNELKSLKNASIKDLQVLWDYIVDMNNKAEV